MGVRFCLICVFKQWHPFHFIDTHFFLSGPGLWPHCLEGVAHLSLEQKLQWKFWCEEVLRRGLSSDLPPCPGSPEKDGQGMPLLGLWWARCTEGHHHPTKHLILVHGPQHAALPSSNTWNVWCSLLTSDTSKTPWECGSLQSRTNSRRWGEAGISPRLQELCSSPLKARTMKTLC